MSNNGVVEFADGQSTATIDVAANNLVIGTTYKATLTLSLKDKAEADTILGNAITAATITVVSDYNWIPAGSGLFYDGDMTGVTADVNIINGEGSNVYRIVAPMAAVTLEAEGKTINGADIEFTVVDGKFVLAPGEYAYDNDGYYSPYSIYYDPVDWAKYCSIEQDGSDVVIKHLIAENGEPTYIGEFAFSWTEGSLLK